MAVVPLLSWVERLIAVPSRKHAIATWQARTVPNLAIIDPLQNPGMYMERKGNSMTVNDCRSVNPNSLMVTRKIDMGIAMMDQLKMEIKRGNTNLELFNSSPMEGVGVSEVALLLRMISVLETGIS